jgi:hypothetical protein
MLNFARYVMACDGRGLEAVVDYLKGWSGEYALILLQRIAVTQKTHGITIRTK